MSAETPAAWQADVKRLAALPPVEYDRQREAAAESLGCRVQTLDSEVKKSRGDGQAEGAGQVFEPPGVEPWPEPVDGAQLLDHLARLFDEYARLPPLGSALLAVWALFSYVFDRFDVCPLLLLSSPEKGCGKTTVLSLLGRLVHRPLMTSNISPAAVFRAVEKWRPTLLLDEAETFFRDNEELRGIMNSGHTRDAAFVVRTVGDDHDPRRFSTWCPKALAGIGKLPGTIEDRSLKLTLQRKKHGEATRRLKQGERFDAERSKCVRWVQDHGAELATALIGTPEFLDNRAADNWEPMFAIAKLVGGDWPERCLRAAKSGAQAAQDSSIGSELLRDVREAFKTAGVVRLSSEHLITLLCEDPESRWREHWHGQCLTPRQLAGLLRGYGIASKSTRLPDGRTPKGYELTQFDEAFASYLPDFAATTPQLRRDGASRPEAIRNTADVVADRDSPQTLVAPTLLRCGGKKEGVNGELTGWATS